METTLVVYAQFGNDQRADLEDFSIGMRAALQKEAGGRSGRRWVR